MEIAFVENALDIGTAFAVFTIGLLAFAIVPFSWVPPRIAVAIYLWHTLFCFYYAWFALYETTDARGYYVRSLQTNPSFIPGTEAVDFVTFVLTQILGLSYLGTFLVYNIIGAVGLQAFLATMREVLHGKGRRIWQCVLVIAFLPGVSFWSVAIGKDSPAFLGAGLCCWAVLDIRKRWAALLLGIFATGVVRPHIAAVVLASLTLGTVVSGKANAMRKFVVLPVLAVPTYFLIQTAMSMVGLGDGGAFADVSELLQYRQSVNMEGTSSIDISSMFLPVQMLVYAFGPLFVGAGGFMGLAASFENTFLIFLVLISAKSFFRNQSSLPAYAKWFFLIFALIMWIVLATTTANLGIALRQKWMFMPMLLLFCLSYLPERHRLARSLKSRDSLHRSQYFQASERAVRSLSDMRYRTGRES